jgi:4-hydroxy-tetrahydrodipicolinate synthase
MLYNLPLFTSALAPSTVRSLITECPNIVGIKDSSGSLDILRILSREGIDACRIVGNDSVLAAALREGICEGVVSGVAGVMPELILSLFSSLPDSSEFQHAAKLLDEFVQQIDVFPTPWGLKWIAEFQGLAPADFSQPVSKRRLEQCRAMREWFQTWYSTTGFAG